MPLYRKKPVVIEAVQYHFTDWPWPKGVFQDTGTFRDPPYVITIHGQKTWLADGDWILPEPDGEHYYPVKPDIFAANYEPVDDWPPGSQEIANATLN